MAIDPEAIERFLEYHPPQLPPFKGAQREWLEKSIADSIGCSYTPKTEMRYYQREGLAAMLWLRRGLLFYDTRIGKSKVALDWASALRIGGKWLGKGLIVAHKPVGLVSWRSEIAKHSHLTADYIESGPNSLPDLVAALDNTKDFVVIAWSTLQSIFGVKYVTRKGITKIVPDKEGLAQLAPFFDLVIYDEIQSCKDHYSLSWQIGVELGARATYRLGLTATPTGRNALHIWAVVFLIDAGDTLSRNYYFFEAAFGEEYTQKIRGIDMTFRRFRTDKMPILQRKLAGVSLSYKRTEIHAENVLTDVIDVPMLPRQAKEYDKILEDIREKGEEATDSTRESAYMRLRQISSGFLPYTDDTGQTIWARMPCSKLEWVEEFLKHMTDDVQLIIFHEFIASGERLEELLEKHNRTYVRLWGGTKDRAEVLRRFQSGEAQIFLANVAAGAMAIDLPMADYILYYESPPSAILRKQSEDRPMARGTKVLVVDDLVCSPVEKRILEIVKEGKSVVSELRKAPEAFFNRRSHTRK